MFNNKKIKQLEKELLHTNLWLGEQEEMINMLADRMGIDISYCDGCGEPTVREFDIDE